MKPNYYVVTVVTKHIVCAPRSRAARNEIMARYGLDSTPPERRPVHTKSEITSVRRCAPFTPSED